jgi:hypothetical protein
MTGEAEGSGFFLARWVLDALEKTAGRETAGGEELEGLS